MGFLNKVIRLLTLTVFFTLISSCVKEAYNITYKGVVVDEETMIPLSNTLITSSCTYQQNIDNSNTINSTSTTDSLGVFSFTFDKGYKISMIIDASDYLLNQIKFYPGSKQIPDTIYLKRKISFQSSIDDVETILRKQ